MVKRVVFIAALLVGCGGGTPTGFGVNVTVDAHAIGSSDLARISTAKLAVTGAETYQKSFDIHSGVKTGEVRFRYIPGVRSGELRLALDAVDASDNVVASGTSGPITLVDGKAVDARIALGAATNDLGATQDLGGEDLAPTKHQGETCSSSSECDSQGGCVDGYCCNNSCQGACQACNLAGMEGICSPVPNGMKPASGHPACAVDSPASCQHDGFCDGNGACRLHVLGTMCKASTCSSNMFTAQSSCDGKGTCVTPASVSCFPYVCKDGSSCYPSCTAGGAECAGGQSCDTTKMPPSCGLKPDGSQCMNDADCLHGHCASKDGSGIGVCCDTPCTSTCMSCALAATRGKCTLEPMGADLVACPAGSGADATCRPGGCDGTAAKCQYSASTTQCRVAACDTQSSTAYAATNCDGAGACPTATPVSCNGFACDGTSCGKTCSSISDCSPGYYCDGVNCLPMKDLGQSCAADGECKTGTFCATYDKICCNTSCGNACEQCNAAGQCVVTPSGPPKAPRACGSGTCAGTCNGSSRSCTYPTDGMVCAASTCSAVGLNSFYEHDHTCKSGACGTTDTSCGNYKCNGIVCGKGPCHSNDDCIVGTTCHLSPACGCALCS